MTTQYRETARTIVFGRELLPRVSGLLSEDFDGVFVISTGRLAPAASAVGHNLGARHAHTQIGATMHVPVSEVASTVESSTHQGPARFSPSAEGQRSDSARQSPAAGRCHWQRSQRPTQMGIVVIVGRDPRRCRNHRPGRGGSATPGALRRRPHRDHANGNLSCECVQRAGACHGGGLHTDATPVSDAIALQAVAQLCAAADSFAEARSPQPGAREQALQGAWLAGHVLGSTTMSLHHKLCHLVGGTCNLPHAATHAVLLPKVLATCAEHAPETYAAFSDALGASEPEKRLTEIAAAAGVPTSLQQLGVSEAQLKQLTSSLQPSHSQQHYDFDRPRRGGAAKRVGGGLTPTSAARPQGHEPNQVGMNPGSADPLRNRLPPMA